MQLASDGDENLEARVTSFRQKHGHVHGFISGQINGFQISLQTELHVNNEESNTVMQPVNFQKEM